jgi:hypothetical protein
VNSTDLLLIAIAFGTVIVALITIYLMRRSDKSSNELPPEVINETASPLSFSSQHTITPFDAQKSKKELRLLDVEQEILSFGIRRIYEAHAEGKIDEKERNRLAENYKTRMRSIKDSITEKESIVALHELESMQDDLIKLFNDRFDDINKKIGGLRVNLNIAPKPVAPKSATKVTSSVPTSKTDKTAKPKRKRSKPKKSEAEEKIDQIRSEVEKVLQRLGQMETEA